MRARAKADESAQNVIASISEEPKQQDTSILGSALERIEDTPAQHSFSARDDSADHYKPTERSFFAPSAEDRAEQAKRAAQRVKRRSQTDEGGKVQAPAPQPPPPPENRIASYDMPGQDKPKSPQRREMLVGRYSDAAEPAKTKPEKPREPDNKPIVQTPAPSRKGSSLMDRAFAQTPRQPGIAAGDTAADDILAEQEKKSTASPSIMDRAISTADTVADTTDPISIIETAITPNAAVQDKTRSSTAEEKPESDVIGRFSDKKEQVTKESSTTSAAIKETKLADRVRAARKSTQKTTKPGTPVATRATSNIVKASQFSGQKTNAADKTGQTAATVQKPRHVSLVPAPPLAGQALKKTAQAKQTGTGQRKKTTRVINRAPTYAAGVPVFPKVKVPPKSAFDWSVGTELTDPVPNFKATQTIVAPEPSANGSPPVKQTNKKAMMSEKRSDKSSAPSAPSLQAQKSVAPQQNPAVNERIPSQSVISPKADMAHERANIPAAPSVGTADAPDTESTYLKDIAVVPTSGIRTVQTKAFAAFEWMIASRYLRARKKEGFVSVIAGFSLVGIALGVATLIVVMAVMTGFRETLISQIIGGSPHINVVSQTGDFENYDTVADQIRTVDGVDYVVPVVQGQVLATGNDRHSGVLVRGIRKGDLELLFKLAEPQTSNGSLDNFSEDDGVALGANLAAKLGLRVGDFITLISPDGDITPFSATPLPRVKDYPIIQTFKLGVQDIDYNVAFMPFAEAQLYFNKQEQADTLDVFVADAQNVEKYTEPILAASRTSIGLFERFVCICEERQIFKFGF